MSAPAPPAAGKVLLLGLSDDYWVPFVRSFGDLLGENGIPHVVALDSRAGEYQCYGRRVLTDRKVYYFSDHVVASQAPAQLAEPPVALRAMFSDYHRLTMLGAGQQAARVDWRRLADQMAQFFADIMDHEAISVVVHDQVSTSFSYVCHEVAARRGIPYLGLVGARIPGRYEVRTTVSDEHDRLGRLYARIVDGAAPLTVDERAWALDYLAAIDHKEPTYMVGNPLADARWHRHANAHKLASFLRKCWYEVREPRDAGASSFRQRPVQGSIRSLVRNLRRAYIQRRFRSYAALLGHRWLATHRFVIYPIHYQPEASTAVGSPHFVDQLSVIRNIAFSLPPDLSLVVKEHRSAVGFSSIRFYRTVAGLPGVRLVAPETPIKDLIRRSDGVVALTSTAAFEALLLDKPAWLLGTAAFQCHPLCTKVDSFAELERALRERQHRPASYDNEAFLVAYRRYTRPGVISYAAPGWAIGADLLGYVRQSLAHGAATIE